MYNKNLKQNISSGKQQETSIYQFFIYYILTISAQVLFFFFDFKQKMI